MTYREMDPPLLTWEMYRDFVEAAGRDLSYLSELINKLPPLHQKFLRYLMYFLHEVAAQSDKNKMAPMNLAIVFAPNMFRSNGDPLEVLANSAQTATVCQAMVVHCATLWPGASNVVAVKQIVVDKKEGGGGEQGGVGGGAGGEEPSAGNRTSVPPKRPQPAPPRVKSGPQPALPLHALTPKNLRPVGRPGATPPTSPPSQHPPTTTPPPSPSRQPLSVSQQLPPPTRQTGPPARLPPQPPSTPSQPAGSQQQQPPQQPPPTTATPPQTATPPPTTTTPPGGDEKAILARSVGTWGRTSGAGGAPQRTSLIGNRKNN